MFAMFNLYQKLFLYVNLSRLAEIESLMLPEWIESATSPLQGVLWLDPMIAPRFE